MSDTAADARPAHGLPLDKTSEREQPAPASRESGARFDRRLFGARPTRHALVSAFFLGRA